MQSKKNLIGMMTKILYVIWSVLVLAILSIIIERTYTYAQYIAKQNATTMVSKDILYRNWVASHGGVYVPVDKRTPPNPYLSHIKYRDVDIHGKEYTLMNPAYTLRQMMSEYSKEYGIKTKITSKLLLNPINRPDSWETLALDKIDIIRDTYMAMVDENNEEYFRLMSPLFVKKGCLKCHAFQGYKIGDIRGGVSVAIPMKPLYKDAYNSSVLTAILFFILWVVGIVAIYMFSKKIYKYLDEKELMYEEYIYGLVSVVEKRDTYTAGHSERVADYAEIIAKEMNIPKSQIHTLHRAGMLHDIGKVGIPDSVFLKPTKLTFQEYDMIKEHVEMGYDMLKNISIFDEIKEIVRDHHEHYDGSGYPRGLSGDEIPLLAHILTLADSFDAMTTDRIYKGRKSVTEALEEIARLSSKQFHPKVVKAALIALKDIRVETMESQKPRTTIEKERFSYFYKDPLTGVFNESYLRSHIVDVLSKSKTILWISLKNFHEYNKEYGWNAGDKVLQSIVKEVVDKKSNDIRVYRFFGDNFLFSIDNDEDIKIISNYVDMLLHKEGVEYNLKVSKSLDDIEDIKILEDVLDKLF